MTSASTTKSAAATLMTAFLIACASSGWVDMSGSFEGWRQVGDANWRIENGEFVADSGAGHLVTASILSAPAASRSAARCVPVRTPAVQTPALRPSCTSTTVSPTLSTARGSATASARMASRIIAGSGRPVPTDSALPTQSTCALHPRRSTSQTT